MSRSLHSPCPGPDDCQVCGAKGKRGCRPGRPLCSEMAKKTTRYSVCGCDGYHFPHRWGSGRCRHHPDGNERQWAYFAGVEPANE